jgi:hypothetical protein
MVTKRIYSRSLSLDLETRKPSSNSSTSAPIKRRFRTTAAYDRIL